VNGGIATPDEVAAQLAHVDGVMLGRAAYHDSYCLATIDALVFGGVAATRAEVVERMHAYATAQVARGTPLRAIARHMLGLYQGRPGARAWRRMLSDAAALTRNDPDLFLAAAARVESPVAAAA
jgi:tRNA-dihydrouridine synthase A